MTGAVPSGIDEISLLPGSHVCAFYRGDSDRDRLLTAYLGTGLSAGDKCICVVDSPYTAKRLESLPADLGGSGSPDGQLDIHLPESTYLAGGEFTTSDMLAFWTRLRGIAHSDSVNGVFPDLRTTDGKTWQDISANMPPALPGEFSFASSGTCVTTQGGRNAWIATGGATIARVLATRDGGNTWNAYNTPLFSSPSGGAFTVDFRDPFDGIVGGGDLDPGNPNSADTATSSDGGQTWTLTNPPPVTGAIFGLSYVGQTGGGAGNHLGRAVVITANDGGAAWTPDEGNTWFALPGVTGYWAVAFASPKAGWLVGTDGRILKISF